MNSHNPKLHVVMYHYVRDLARTKFPKIKGMQLADFREQVAWIASNFEMVNLDAALEFLQGTYRPDRDLCVFTFDDGLKEHYASVTPILAEHKIQGLFGVITSCIENQSVAPVHMNHFLMAELDFEVYRSAFMQRLHEVAPGVLALVSVNPEVAQRSYPLDTQEVATFKFLFNFALEANLRDAVVKDLFDKYLGDEQSFARELYMSWEEVREIQRAGMLVAGHTHWHRPLSTLSDEELGNDLRTAQRLLDENAERQELWPFSYPYGKQNSYSTAAIKLLGELGYACAFNTECGANMPGTSVFELHRIDCKDAVQDLQSHVRTPCEAANTQLPV
jgi:peptidoglycan/xylan/chitin deacetylase (PgdA/CDA1 family)